MVKSESDIIDTIHTGQVITDENGTQYFVCGKNRIKISEHFAAGGRPIGDLIVDVVRHTAEKDIEYGNLLLDTCMEVPIHHGVFIVVGEQGQIALAGEVIAHK